MEMATKQSASKGLRAASLITVFVAGVAAALVASAGLSRFHRDEPPDELPPGLTTPLRTVNVGVVAPSTKAETEIVLKNIGAVDYSIDDVRTDCGCTTTGLTTKTLPRNSELKVPVSYLAASLFGPFHHKVVVSVINISTSKKSAISFELIGEVATPSLIVFPNTLRLQKSGTGYSDTLFVRGSDRLLKQIPDQITLGASNPIAFNLETDGGDLQGKEVRVFANESIKNDPTNSKTLLVFNVSQPQVNPLTVRINAIVIEEK
jgi:hypothetical protein